MLKMKGGIRLYITFLYLKNHNNPTNNSEEGKRLSTYLESFVITAYNKRPVPETFVPFFILTQTKLPFNTNNLKGPVAFAVNISLS